MLTTFILTAGIMLVVFGLIAIRLLILPGGEFHGTCGCHNDAVKAEDNEELCTHGGHVHRKDDCAHVCDEETESACQAGVLKRAIAAKAAKASLCSLEKAPAHAP